MTKRDVRAIGIDPTVTLVSRFAGTTRSERTTRSPDVGLYPLAGVVERRLLVLVRMKTLLTIAIMTFPLFACGERVSYENEGALCAFASDPDPFFTTTTQDLVAGAPVEMMVVMDSCVSSSCTSDITTGCEVSLDGDRILVTSAGSYNDDTGSLGGCTDDCRAVFATCSTPPLAAGSYTVVHGADTMQLDIPATLDRAPCTASTL